MRDAVYLLLVLLGLTVALVAMSIGQFFTVIAVRILAGVKRVRSWSQR
jgi:hypothetical protein